MAQEAVHEITLWEPDLGSDITPAAPQPAIWRQIEDFKINEKLGEVETATFKFSKGAYLPLDTVLTERTVLKVQYGDPATSWKLFRVMKINFDTTGSRGVTVTCRAMWNDLANVIMRQTRTGGYVDLSVTLIGNTLSEALTEMIATDHGLPSTFVHGTINTQVVDIGAEKVVIQYFNSTFMQVLRDLASQILTTTGHKAEFEFVWNNGTGKYSINWYTELGWVASELSAGVADPTLRPVHGPNITTDSNRLKMTHVRDSNKYFNRLIPTSGSEEELVTIINAEFYGSQEDTGWIKLEAGIRIVAYNGQHDGLFIGNESIGFSEILDSDTDLAGRNAFQTDGDESAMVDEWLKFAISSGGDGLVYLEDTDQVAIHGAVEKAHSFSDIMPYPNLLVRAGVIASMDEATGGLIDGWTEIGNPTTTLETSTEFFRWGAGSQKVVTVADGEGIEASFTVVADDKQPHISCWVNLRSDGTNLVRIEFEDVDGNIFPSTESAESNVDELRGLALGGFVLAPGVAKIKIYAPAAGTTFYVDSVAVTQSPSAYEYRDKMGPALLFEDGIKYLAENGGIVPAAIQGDFLDVTAFQSGTEIVLGSHVEYKDIYSGTGSPIIDVTTRVAEIETREGKFEGRFKKRVRLSNKRADFTGRWRGVRRDIPVIDVPPVDIPPVELPEIPGERTLPVFNFLKAEYLYTPHPYYKTSAGFKRIVPNSSRMEEGKQGTKEKIDLYGTIVPDMGSFAWDVHESESRAAGLVKDTAADTTDYTSFPAAILEAIHDNNDSDDFIAFGSGKSGGPNSTVLLDVKTSTSTRFLVTMNSGTGKIDFAITNDAAASATVSAGATDGYSHEAKCMWLVAWDSSLKTAYVGLMDDSCNWDWQSLVRTGTFGKVTATVQGATTGKQEMRYMATFTGADLSAEISEAKFVDLCRWLKPWLQSMGHYYCISGFQEEIPDPDPNPLPGERHLSIFNYLRAEYPYFPYKNNERLVKNHNKIGGFTSVGTGVMTWHLLGAWIGPDMDSFAWDDQPGTKILGLEKDVTANDTDYVAFPAEAFNEGLDIGVADFITDFFIFGEATSEGGADTVLLDIKTTGNTRFKVTMNSVTDKIDFAVTNSTSTTTTTSVAATTYLHEDVCMWMVGWDQSLKTAFVAIMDDSCNWTFTSAVLTGTFETTIATAQGFTTGLQSQRYLATFCGADLSLELTEDVFVSLCRWLKPWLQTLGHDFCIDSYQDAVGKVLDKSSGDWLCLIDADICISNKLSSGYDINITPADDINISLPAGSFFNIDQSAGYSYLDIEDYFYFETRGDIEFRVLGSGTGDITIANNDNDVGLYAGKDIIINPGMDTTGYLYFSNYPGTPVSGRTAEDEYIVISYGGTVRYLKMYS